jgi:DNA-binding CsgD family transcriptional regulator
MQLDQNHISLQSEAQIKHILAPLANSCGIQYFSYGVNFADTSGFTLISHAEYYESAINQEFPLCGFHLDAGWHLWNTTLPSAQKKLSENLNIGNGILFVNHQEDRTEIIEFATQADNDGIYDFYMNNSNILKKFMNYFKNEAVDLIEIAKDQAIKPLASMILENKIAQISNTQKYHAELTAMLNEASYPLSLLSKREMQCFLYLIKGYSISEISKEIDLAIPTIANYICRIKQKLKCSSKQEMIKLAYDLGFIEYYFPKAN